MEFGGEEFGAGLFLEDGAYQDDVREEEEDGEEEKFDNEVEEELEYGVVEEAGPEVFEAVLEFAEEQVVLELDIVDVFILEFADGFRPGVIIEDGVDAFALLGLDFSLHSLGVDALFSVDVVSLVFYFALLPAADALEIIFLSFLNDSDISV